MIKRIWSQKTCPSEVAARHFEFGTRILCIFLTIEWYLFLTSSASPQLRFSLRYLLYTGPIAASLNIGLWLATTVWGRKKKLLSSVLLLPALLLAHDIVRSYSITFSSLVLAVCLGAYWNIFRKGPPLNRAPLMQNLSRTEEQRSIP